MRGIKIGSVFAACGFLLSFMSGLFSHTSIISVLLKALIFAIIFGLLGFGIDFLYSKFLAGESSGSIGDDSGAEIKSNAGGQSSTGHYVDITIDDEDLEKGGSENHFVVNDNHQMLNQSDYASKPVSPVPVQKEAEEVSNGFVPLKNFETLKSLSGKEAVQPAETVAAVSSVTTSSAKDNDLDTLPDMNNFSFESNDNSASEDADDVDTDEGFESSANIHRSSSEPTEIKDASLMAKAISSILSDEDS